MRVEDFFNDFWWLRVHLSYSTYMVNCENKSCKEARIQIKLIFDLFYASSNNSSSPHRTLFFALFITLEIGIPTTYMLASSISFSLLLFLRLLYIFFFIIINCFLVHVLSHFELDRICYVSK